MKIEEIIKSIELGQFKNDYLIYNRKSTDDAESQKNSITYQREKNLEFAAKKNFKVAKVSIPGFCSEGIISEKHSAFKEDEYFEVTESGTVQFKIDRPKFQQLVQFLNKKYFKGIIFLCWDRASRNKADEAIIRKLMKIGIDFQFTLASYDKTSSGELHMDIDGMFSGHHSRVTSEKVSLAIASSKAKGLCHYKAPTGYLNLGNMDNKPFDEVRAPIVKEMFMLKYNQPKLSVADICRWAIQQGFTLQPMRRRRTREEKSLEEEDEIDLKIEKTAKVPTPQSIHKILTNPFYKGYIKACNGAIIKSISHEALVDENIFDKVQINLQNNCTSKHYAEINKHPFRNYFSCEECHRVFTPYIKKGIQYYSSRCKNDCTNTTKNINLELFLSLIKQKMSALSFTKEELDDFDTRLSTDIALLESKRLNEFENTDRRKRKLREDLAYIRENKLNLLRTGAYTAEAVVAEEKKLEDEIGQLISNEVISEEAMRDTMKDVRKVSERLNHLVIYWDFCEISEKEEITRIIFSELSIRQKTLSFKLNPGFMPFENRFTNSSATW